MRAVREIANHARRLLRRSAEQNGDVLHFADLALCRKTRSVTRAERHIELTRTEFDLLELFMTNPGRVLDRSLISERVWGFDFSGSSNSMNVYIGYLRRKLGEPSLIQTVRGVGYVLREP